MLIHSVYIYFKSEIAQERIDKCIEMARGLSRIETAKEVYVGTPADVAKRPVCVVDYTIALTVVFDSKDDHDTYQDHALHTQFIEMNRLSWEKVVVYDFD